MSTQKVWCEGYLVISNRFYKENDQVRSRKILPVKGNYEGRSLKAKRNEVKDTHGESVWEVPDGNSS